MYGRDGICSLKSYMTWIVRFSVILLKKFVPHTRPVVIIFFSRLSTASITRMPVQHTLDLLRKILGVVKKFLKSRSFLYQTQQNP